MSNKKAPQYPSKKQRSDSIENKNILVPKKENKMKHVLVTNGNTSLGVTTIKKCSDLLIIGKFEQN